LSNIRAFGPRLGESVYSGNLKAVKRNGELCGVFCVTRGGSLLAQTGGRAEYADHILQAVAAEGIPVRGVIGEWHITSALWTALIRTGRLRPTFDSREASYRLRLKTAVMPVSVDPGADVRMLTEQDHEQWEELELDYQEEVGLPAPGTRVQREAAFIRSTNLGHWWGAFEGDRLVSLAAIIALYENLAQIGGVFTVPDRRKSGLSRAVMARLITDSINQHHLDQLFLFTGEHNEAARRLYESFGFERIGDFGLFFGDPL